MATAQEQAHGQICSPCCCHAAVLPEECRPLPCLIRHATFVFQALAGIICKTMKRSETFHTHGS